MLDLPETLQAIRCADCWGHRITIINYKLIPSYKKQNILSGNNVNFMLIII